MKIKYASLILTGLLYFAGCCEPCVSLLTREPVCGKQCLENVSEMREVFGNLSMEDVHKAVVKANNIGKRAAISRGKISYE